MTVPLCSDWYRNNVNTTEFADEIKETASSLFVETGKNIKRSRIVALFAEEFTKYYQKFLNTGDLSGLVQDYNEMLINVGRQVRICDAKEEFTGVAAGIDQPWGTTCDQRGRHTGGHIGRRSISERIIWICLMKM